MGLVPLNATHWFAAQTFNAATDAAIKVYQGHQDNQIRLAEIKAMQDVAKEKAKLESEVNRYSYQIQNAKCELQQEYLKGLSICAQKLIDQGQFEQAGKILESMAQCANSPELLPRGVFRQ